MVSGHFTHLPLFITNEMMKERLQKRLLVTEQKRRQPIWWNVKGTVICEGTEYLLKDNSQNIRARGNLKFNLVKLTI